MDFIHNLFHIKSNGASSRIAYLDFIRGIIILLVLYHHSEAPYGRYILQFHMPALFILSGYTEYLLNRAKPFQAYVKSKFYRLIVPYFCFEVLNLLLYLIFQRYLEKSFFTASDAFVSIITCINNNYIGLYGRLWFLPAIFFSSIFSYLIKRHAKGNPLSITIWCFAMFLLSYASDDLIPHRLPFTLDTALLGTAFSLMGFLLGRPLQVVFESRKYSLDLLLLVISIALFALGNVISDPFCGMYDNVYTNFPFMVICATAGTVFTFVAAKYLFTAAGKLPFFKDYVLWYSNNSLAVFPMHLTVKIFSIVVLFYVGIFHWATLLAFMLIFTIPAVNFINAYMPFMLGNSDLRKKKQKEVSP